MKLVLKVVQLRQTATELISGFHLDKPVDGAFLEGQKIMVGGWVVGRESPVSFIEVSFYGDGSITMPLETARPDVALLFPNIDRAGKSGFQTLIPVERFVKDTDVTVTAVLENGAKVKLASIRPATSSPAISDADKSLNANSEVTVAQELAASENTQRTEPEAPLATLSNKAKTTIEHKKKKSKARRR